MKFRILTMALPAMAAGACTAPGEGGFRLAGGGQVPEAVRTLAAPHQDVSTARLQPEDGCYWYLHAGPVETTLLPLRTADGRPICTSPPA